MKKWLKLMVSILLLGFIGCASMDVTPIGTLPERRPSSKVDVYTGKDMVKKKYREIAVLSVDDQGWEMKDSKLVSQMIAKAQEIGADGIILGGGETYSSGGVGTGTVIGNTAMIGSYASVNNKVRRAIAIVYEDSSGK